MSSRAGEWMSANHQKLTLNWSADDSSDVGTAAAFKVAGSTWLRLRPPFQT